MHKLLEKYEENVKGGLLHGTCSIHFLVSSHQPLEINFCKLILNRINRRERRSGAPHNIRTNGYLAGGRACRPYGNTIDTTVTVVQNQLCWPPLAADR